MAAPLRFPAPLKAGDVVRIVAPSGVFARDKLEPGLALLEAAGLRPRFDEGLFAKHRYLAGDDRRRAAELAQALADPEARAVWLARGGYGATRLLPGLKVAGIAPRWFVGFSDATALHALLNTAGVGSVHGPNVTTLAGWSHEARVALWELLLRGQGPSLSGRTWCPGPAVEGPLVGGNLTVLAAMAGTGFWPPRAGGVVLLEDIGEQVYRLDRSLTQLMQGGFFTGVRAVLIGQLTDCKAPDGADYDAATVVKERLAELGVPVIGELPVGHEPSSFALALGAQTRVDPQSGRVSQELA